MAPPPPGSRDFSPDKDIPDLKGKVILVTGGTSGLGQECILQFAKHNPSQIFFTARSIIKGKETMAKIEKVVPDARLTFVQLDLTSLASVEDAAKIIIESTDRLDILMNNAGIMMAPASTTKDGYEIQFGTNHMGHALLTKLLLPTLVKTSKMPGSDVRIIHLSSGAHSWAPKEGIVFSEVKTKQSNISNHARYAQSKLANVLFSNELARRYPDLTCVSLHPGSVDTGLSRGVMKSFPILSLGLPLLQWSGLMTVSVQEGVLTQLWASTSRDAKSGKYYEPVAREVEGSPFLKDEKLGERLWDFTMEECDRFLRLPREKKVKHVRIVEPEGEGSWFAVIPPIIAVLLICYVVKLIMVGLSEQTRSF